MEYLNIGLYFFLACMAACLAIAYIKWRKSMITSWKTFILYYLMLGMFIYVFGNSLHKLYKLLST